MLKIAHGPVGSENLARASLTSLTPFILHVLYRQRSAFLARARDSHLEKLWYY